jgi:glycerol dehydrogenase
MALKLLLAPLRYVQGPNALSEIGAQLQTLGIRKPLVLASRTAKKMVEAVLAEGLMSKGMAHTFIEFGGESSWKEIERIKNACIAGGHDAIVSCGGGKTLDAGRCAAAASAVNAEKFPLEVIPEIGANVACINVPTVAATDASTSAFSMVYTEEGTLEAALLVPTNPTMVLVDTAIIARAPVRFFVAGMGDALATHFEAAMSQRTDTPCPAGGQSTLAAQALGRLCFDTLMEYGVAAKTEVEGGIPGPFLEAVTEANVLLSGLGFESGGLSAAHAIGLAFHHIEECFETNMLHGELVAFATLTQLVMEGRKPDDVGKIFRFCKEVGLPTTFEELHLRVTPEDLQTVANVASKHAIIRSMPGANRAPDLDGRFYDHQAIFRALKGTDAFGRVLGGSRLS